jgi:alpha/beta superfamily hydrolase
VHRQTDDGVRLTGLVVRRKHSRNERAVVVGHGFTNHVRKPFVTRILYRLSRTHTVIALDFRRHGRSGGLSTAGPAEVHDLDAAVVTVSAAARWWTRDTEAMRRLFWLAELPYGRLVMRALRVRLAPPTIEIPASPVEVAHRIAPTPLLLVHGDGDHYVGVDHPLALHRATGGRAGLWLERGMRHAETAMTPQLVDRVAAWLADQCESRTSEAERTAA